MFFFILKMRVYEEKEINEDSKCLLEYSFGLGWIGYFFTWNYSQKEKESQIIISCACLSRIVRLRLKWIFSLVIIIDFTLCFYDSDPETCETFRIDIFQKLDNFFSIVLMHWAFSGQLNFLLQTLIGKLILSQLI